MDALVKQRGMTLVEVMVAAVILALVMMGVIAVATHTQRSTLRLNQTSQALWVANSLSAEIRAGLHGEITSTGTFQGQFVLGQNNWFWKAQSDAYSDEVINITLTVHEKESAPAVVTLVTGFWRPS